MSASTHFSVDDEASFLTAAPELESVKTVSVVTLHSEQHTLLAKIQELAYGDRAIAQHFIQLLIKTDSATLSELHDAFRTSSWDVAAAAVHRITGSLRMLDCATLIALASTFEAAIRDGDIRRARAMLPAITHSLERLNRSLRALLDSADTAE
ncbi:Hpt domain-containing protein [Paraburkholderia sp.]|uniref:Hpt domain-containing protein n=1 Tax=Paraburkholderia sp. TaxID=1926495 RepID=UPI00239E8583|nr:Hpt domain-containing protein [Paraburkholderia sp.]MDE1182020.1 Hpt domain-containing protein [Paraburkholderia sp.]